MLTPNVGLVFFQALMLFNEENFRSVHILCCSVVTVQHFNTVLLLTLNNSKQESATGSARILALDRGNRTTSTLAPYDDRLQTETPTTIHT